MGKDVGRWPNRDEAVGMLGFRQTLAVPMVYRVVEEVDTRGRYALLERHPIRTPHLMLRNVCGYR